MASIVKTILVGILEIIAMASVNDLSICTTQHAFRGELEEKIWLNLRRSFTRRRDI